MPLVDMVVDHEEVEVMAVEEEDMVVEAVVAAEVVESFQLPSKLDTIFNTEMFHHLDL